jgi:hypothetical protein
LAKNLLGSGYGSGTRSGRFRKSDPEKNRPDPQHCRGEDIDYHTQKTQLRQYRYRVPGGNLHQTKKTEEKKNECNGYLSNKHFFYFL